MTKSLVSVLGLGLAVGLAATSADAAKIVVDFSQGGTSNAVTGTTSDGLTPISYNRVQGAATGTVTIASLQDTSGTLTGITLTRTSATELGSNNVGLSGTANTGTLTSPANAMFPDTAGQQFVFVGSNAVVDASYSEWTFSNLSIGTQYTFDLLSARSTSGTRVTNFTVTGSTVGTGSINSCLNTGTLVTIAGIAPDNSGNIVLKYSNGTAGQFGYLNAVQVSTVPEPATLGLLGLGSLALMARRRAKA